MSAAVMSPTPALPMARKVSIWEKILAGFKPKDSKNAEKKEEVVEVPHLSISTGVEKNTPTVYKRNDSIAARGSNAALSIKSARTANTRAGSFSSNCSRRSSNRWWRSSNPYDSDAPPVPTIESKYSMFGSHNPDVDSMSPTSPTTLGIRRPSYVPRNAASSFLKTTTNPQMRKNSQDDSTKSNMMVHASLKPIQIKTIELRKDSHLALEKHGMFSMVGVCDIIEDVDEEAQAMAEDDLPISPTSEGVDRLARQTFLRSDSANASSELLALKNVTRRTPSPMSTIMV